MESKETQSKLEKKQAHDNEAFEGGNERLPVSKKKELSVSVLADVTSALQDSQSSPRSHGDSRKRSSSENEMATTSSTLDADSIAAFNSLDASTSSPDGIGQQYAHNIQIAGEANLAGKHNRDEHIGTRQFNGNFVINWHNLDYVVQSKWYKLSSQRKPILDSLSGQFKSGELTAILGPSGAGKSTLIDCLLGKHERGLSGTTRVEFFDNSDEPDRSLRPLKIALIPQKDHLLDSLTVMETFMFASKIKNAHLARDEVDEKKAFDHLANVQRVLKQLNLSSCANLRCGKLSGGQYKRVSIGQELLSRPDLLILDEPTSGLDSLTCFQTVSALRELLESSQYPMAIVATIHQPDTEVFQLFHKAYVLASGGRAIYEGPTEGIFPRVKQALELVERRKKSPLWQLASSADSADDLARLASRVQVEADLDYANPARLIVELAAGAHGFEIVGALNELQRRSWTRSQLGSGALGSSASLDTQSSSTTKSVHLDLDVSDGSRIKQAHTGFDYCQHEPALRRPNLDKMLRLSSAANLSRKRSFGAYLKHLLLHTQRSWKTIVRDPMLFTVQVILHVLVPLLISYSLQAQQYDACPSVGPLDVVHEAFRPGNVLDELNMELRSAFDNLGYIFFQIYVIIFAAVCVTSLTYPLAMHVLLKEYRNGWYSMSSYFIGRTLADLPVPTFNVVLAMAISYHLTGQPMSPYAWRFISVATLTVLATLVAQTQGLMFGALLMNAPQSAVFVAPASTAPLVVVSGFLFRIKSLPIPLQFLSRLSYFTYLLNGIIVSRYGFNRCDCQEDDFEIQANHEVPSQARALISLWLQGYSNEYPNATAEVSTDSPDLIEKLVRTITRAKMFGYNMTDCSQVKPFTMLDYNLDDSDLAICFVALGAMLIAFRWLTWLVLTWKIKSSI